MAEKVKTGKKLERRVAEAYRQMGARKVEHNRELGGNQIDVYVELEATGRLLHRIAVEAKDYARPVGKGIVVDFAAVVDFLRRERLIDEGVVVSVQGFSTQARNAADTAGIRLLQIDDLEAMAAGARAGGRTRPTRPPIPQPPAPHFAHPYPLQENFTGRVHEREMLTRWWTGGGRPVLALTALGGMGKSALAWAWLQRDVLGQPLPGHAPEPPGEVACCRVAEGERPEGVLWWSFYEREARFAAFVDEALAYAGGGEIDPASLPSTYDKVRVLCGLLQRKRLLLVLDGFERELRAYASLSAAYQGNAVEEDPRGDFRACTDPHAAAFLRWIGGGALAGRVLITGRLFPRELDGMAGCRRWDLRRLDPDDAVAFFHAQGVRGTRAEVQAACRPYGYHPLALRLLAGLVVRDPARPGDVAAAAGYDVGDDLVPREHHVLKLAYDALAPELRALLSRIAAFRGPVAYDVLQVLNPFAGKRELGRAVRELEDRGLLFRNREAAEAGAARYDLHPVVRGYAYDRLAGKAGVHAQLRDYFAAVPPPDEEQVQRVEDLAPTIELYHHTVRAGRYDEAFALFRDRLYNPLYYRFGAYQTCIELLRALFPDGEDRPPRLGTERDQSWAATALANAHSLSGQPRRAVSLFGISANLDEDKGDKLNLAIDLGNLACMAQIYLGELAAAERNLRRRVALCREIGNEFNEAIGHQELGRLLAYRGAFDEAAGELETALASFGNQGARQSECVVWAYRALRALLLGDAGAALEAARRARKLADIYHPGYGQIERDIIGAEWLLGRALVALSRPDEAEGHLAEALRRCRRINLVELEPDVLLAWARWHDLEGNREEARRHAEEALAIADRCEYRLVQADAHNFLARWHLAGGDLVRARHHAAIAKERAWCDGPPYCYRPAVDEAERLLADIAAAG
jgi:tetratricopeptide (TPR) repeat protein